MERTVKSHDVQTGEALIRFEHKDVIIEEAFNLKMVIPGSQHIFDQMNIEFTEEHQLAALERLTERLTQQIDDGVLVNAPSDEVSSPVVVEEPTEENTGPTT